MTYTILSRIFAAILVAAVIGLWRFGFDIHERVGATEAQLNLGPRWTSDMDHAAMAELRRENAEEFTRNKEMHHELEKRMAEQQVQISTIANTVQTIVDKGIPPAEVLRRLDALEAGQIRMEQKQDAQMLLLVEMAKEQVNSR